MMKVTDNIPVTVPLGVMARRLHVPPKWLRQEAEAGRIPALQAGDRFVFRPDIVARIVAERAAVPHQEADHPPVIAGGVI